jgi:hypothetical protein
MQELEQGGKFYYWGVVLGKLGKKKEMLDREGS